MKPEKIKELLKSGRRISLTDAGNLKETASLSAASADDSFDPDLLGPLKSLVGTWESTDRGWNLIALPFDPGTFNYRLLMNQYGEKLNFAFVDKNIPNRGVTPDSDGITDQLLSALDYTQVINQVEVDDFPCSDLRADNGKGIHHEPGLFLNILNHTSTTEDGKELQVARQAAIPHGDSVLAMGHVTQCVGGPTIPDLNALPVRVNQDLSSPYLEPYKHFNDNPFFGTVPNPTPGFPGFEPVNANAILQSVAKNLNVKETTTLHFDTKFGTGGIVNIPFIVREANATEMVSTFWIMELEKENDSDPTEFVMQYSQTVFLDFFPSRDEPGELIRWPHVSINMLSKTVAPYK